MSSSHLAGFWLRFVAFMIDAVVLAVVYLLLIIPLYSYAFPDYLEEIDEVDPARQSEVLSLDGVASVVNFSQAILILVMILYHASLEASRYQGSVGKIALELHVTDLSGKRLSFSHALLRNAAKLFSSLVLMLGFVMAAFTRQKQALHDMVARTLVVKK